MIVRNAEDACHSCWESVSIGADLISYMDFVKSAPSLAAVKFHDWAKIDEQW